MRVFLTGGTGFIGGALAAALRERGDEVAALVRSPAKGESLRALGCEMVEGTLSDDAAIRRGLAGADAVIHAAAVYEVGIKESEHAAMYEANVAGTERVLRAALEAGVAKAVYVSTIAAFGNTHGKVVEEGHEQSGPHTSYYEETKVLAHRAARAIGEEGLPLVIVQPGGVYGPDDHSALGDVLERFARKRLPAVTFPGLGLNAVHRDDVVAGILLALDKGRPGESYVLGGELTTMRGAIEALARVQGRRPPRMTMPTGVLRAIAPLGPVIGPAMGFPPNFRELISASEGVTYWARDDKARRDLGYAPRSLEQGLRETFARGA